MSEEIQEKLKKYPSTENFTVVDVIGVPHLFCITPRHIEAAQKYSGQLGKPAIQELEKNGRPSCGVRGCNLMYEEHELGLLVRCKTKDKDLTQEYLNSILKMCEEDGYAGFALLDGTGGDQ